MVFGSVTPPNDGLRGPFAQNNKKIFIIRSIVMKICTHMSWIFFSIFIIENLLFTENVKRREFAVTNVWVERFNLHGWYVYQSKQKFVLYKVKEFFSNYIIHYTYYTFFQKNAFLPKKLKFKTVIFLWIRKLKKKTLCNFVEHKIPLLLIPISVL